MASTFLQRVLLANASFSALSGLSFVVAASEVSGFLGFLSSTQVLTLGAQLLVFASWVFWLARREIPRRGQVMVLIALDVLWVVGSAALLVAPPAELSTAAMWAVGIVADIVLVFAVLEIVGLRRLPRPAHA